MPIHNEDAEMANVIDQNVLVSEAGGCLAKNVLRYPGIFCSLLGFGGFGGSFFSLSFLNRWLHLGHFKWILHCVPLLFGLIGLGLIWCSCPSARAKIKQVCCGKCMKRKNQYDRLVNSSVDERGEIAT